MKTLVRKPGVFSIALILIFLTASTVANATNYFSNGNQDPSNVNNWWTGTNGTGSHPGNFNSGADAFFIQNGHNMSTTASWTVAGNVTIQSGGILTINSGNTDISFGSFTVSSGGSAVVNRDLAVSGATLISGTISFGSSSTQTRSMTFTGAVTLNSGAVWNETTTGAAADFTFVNNLTNNATTFTAQNTGHTFSGSGTLSGSTAIVIPSVTFAGNYTNNGTLICASSLTINGGGVRLTNNGTVTATSALSGGAGVTQGATGVLNIGGSSTITTLTATAPGNTVNYTGTGQTVKVTAYSNLGLSGSGNKTFATGITIGNNLSINTSAIASMGNNNFSSPTLTLNGAGQIIGTYGSTASAATNKIAGSFGTTGTGILTVTVGSCINPLPFNVTGGGAYCAGTSGTAIGVANSQTGVNYQLFIGVSTPVGSPVAGNTGSAISFGNQLAVGTYTVVATNTVGGCTTNMNGSATVTINALPTTTAVKTDVQCFNTGTGTIVVTGIGRHHLILSLLITGQVTRGATPSIIFPRGLTR